MGKEQAPKGKSEAKTTPSPRPTRGPIPNAMAANMSKGASRGRMLAMMGLPAGSRPFGLTMNGPPSTSIARKGIAGPGSPLDAELASKMSQQIGHDVSGARVHTSASAAQATRSLGTRAYAFGDDIAFASGAYSPSTSRGRGLLAHELTHVAQQARGGGDTASLEREADRARAGARPSLGSTRGSTPQLLFDNPCASRLTITMYDNGTARFRVDLVSGGPLGGSGTASGMPPGTYTVFMPANGTQMTIRGGDRSVTERFNIHVADRDAGVVHALQAAQSPIPLIVRAGGEAPDPSSSLPAPTRTETAEALRARLAALPPRIRAFFFGTTGRPFNPSDSEQVLRIAAMLQGLTEAELAEFRERTSASTASLSRFESSVSAYVAHVTARRAAVLERENAKRALVGLDGVYELYRSWARNLGMMNSPSFGFPPHVPSWVRAAEAVPASQIAQRFPGDHGAMGALYIRLRLSLDANGYQSLNQFVTALNRFVVAFREEAYFLSEEMLDRYAHQLKVASTRYSATAETDQLHRDLGTSRMYFNYADEHRRSAQSGGLSPSDFHRSYAAGPYNQRIRERGFVTARRQASRHPLLGNRNFPIERAARADQAGVRHTMTSYIASGNQGIRNTRDRLRPNHELIFKLPPLVNMAKSRQGIRPNSIWAKVLADHVAPSIDQAILDVMIPVVMVAVGIMSGGTLLGAAGLGAASTYLAYQEYQEYAFQHDAHAAQLLANEPSLFWVVVAIVGAGFDLAAVGHVIRGVRAMTATMRTADDLARLETQLAPRLESLIPDAAQRQAVHQALIDSARRRVRWSEDWSRLARPWGPAGMRVSFLVLETAEGIAKATYAVYLGLKRGIMSLDDWVRTREAIDLLGRAATAEDLVHLRRIHGRLLADARRISDHGVSLRMTDDQIHAAIRSWADTGTGSVDDLIRNMRRPLAQGLQGFSPRQFRRFARGARRLTRQARLPNGELVVQGSRVRGSARTSRRNPAGISDVDIALIVDRETFFRLAEESLSRARPGTRLRRTMLRRINVNGQLSSFDLGSEFIALRRALLDAHTPGIPVQFSILLRGGKLDTGPIVRLR